MNVGCVNEKLICDKLHKLQVNLSTVHHARFIITSKLFFYFRAHVPVRLVSHFFHESLNKYWIFMSIRNMCVTATNAHAVLFPSLPQIKVFRSDSNMIRMISHISQSNKRSLCLVTDFVSNFNRALVTKLFLNVKDKKVSPPKIKAEEVNAPINQSGNSHQCNATKS